MQWTRHYPALRESAGWSSARLRAPPPPPANLEPARAQPTTAKSSEKNSNNRFLSRTQNNDYLFCEVMQQLCELSNFLGYPQMAFSLTDDIVRQFTINILWLMSRPHRAKQRQLSVFSQFPQNGPPTPGYVCWLKSNRNGVNKSSVNMKTSRSVARLCAFRPINYE